MYTVSVAASVTNEAFYSYVVAESGPRAVVAAYEGACEECLASDEPFAMTFADFAHAAIANTVSL